jgi:fibronectin-binding autotransporter adhesin
MGRRAPTGIGTASENHAGNEATAAGQWSLPREIDGIGDGAAMLTPRLGVQYLHLSEAGFSDAGADGFDLSAGGHGTDSLQPYVGAALSQKFVTNDGTPITPELRLGYAYEVYDTRLLAVTTASGTPFLVNGIAPSRNQFSAGLGLTTVAGPNLQLYVNYDALLPTGNLTDQTVQAGLRWKF